VVRCFSSNLIPALEEDFHLMWSLVTEFNKLLKSANDLELVEYIGLVVEMEGREQLEELDEWRHEEAEEILELLDTFSYILNR
jgi:hypothetical protein